MFFLCASIAAIVRYWLNLALLQYFSAGNEVEAHFFHQYMVLLHVVLLPLYILITYLVFKNSVYNYAEVGVLTLYNVAAFFLIVSIISLLKFIWYNLDTAYIELPVLIIYNTITFLYFFHLMRRWLVIVKAILILVSMFMLAHYSEKLVMSII